MSTVAVYTAGAHEGKLHIRTCNFPSCAPGVYIATVLMSHPLKVHVLQLLHYMITYTHPVAGNLPIKTLVAR